MAGTVTPRPSAGTQKSQRGSEESPLVKWLLTGVALLFAGVFLLLPLVNVFAQAFAKGLPHYWASLAHPDSLAAMRLTLLVAAISVPLNVVFGLAAAWAIAWLATSKHAALSARRLARGFFLMLRRCTG
jgi:sulfate transport system permease protein